MGLYFRGKGYEENSSDRVYDQKLLKILWAFALPFRGLLSTALLFMLLAALIDLSRPYLLKLAIDSYIAGGDLAGLKGTALLYAGSIIISSVIAYGETMLLQTIGQRIIYNIRERVFIRLIKQNMGNLDNQAVGAMLTRVTNDTDAVKDLYTDVLVAFSSDLIILTGIVGVMLWMNWQLALVSFLVIPLMFLLTFFYQKFAREAYRNIRGRTAAINTFLQESMNGIAVVKAFYIFHKTTEEYRTINREYLKAGLREMRGFAVFRPMVDLIYMLATVIVLAYGGVSYGYSYLEIGVIVAFINYIDKFFWPIKDLSEKYNLLQSALAAAERIYDLLDEKQNSYTTPEHLLENDRKFKGNIRFENVWFAYTEKDWVLKDVSFSITAGSFVGIVGASGSGKTTLVNLMLRFYEPQQGKIYLDEVDIRNIPVDILRRNIGVVFQDVHLFKGSIAENIALFNPDIAEQEVALAAERANVDPFIRELPLKYHTSVGYHGALLSAGQRQLISLARVFAWGATIVVLDEATSSIDSATEKMIQNALEKNSKRQTIVVVAHRLSTIRNADTILVFSKGRLIEAGTHEDLYNIQGIYFHLFNSQ